MKIIQFFLSGIVYMAEFRVNGVTHARVVMSQNGQHYLCTGDSFHGTLERHNFTSEQTQSFYDFIKEVAQCP